MDYLGQIAQNGILGLLLVVSLVAVYFLYKENRTLQDKRINDLVQTRDAYMGAMDGIKQTVDLILSVVQTKWRK